MRRFEHSTVQTHIPQSHMASWNVLWVLSVARAPGFSHYHPFKAKPHPHPPAPRSLVPIRFTVQAHRMASSLGCLVSLPQMFVEHRVIPQINICKMLSHTPREILTLVKIRELTEQALLLVLKKEPTVIILIIK